ncbi:MAG: hypothetical protein H7838_07475 [Magnetococcus sp. DMHC-8]
MKHIVQLLLLLLLLVPMGRQGETGEYDPKPEFRSNFLYGTQDSMSPDYKRAMEWIDAQSRQVKAFTRRLIGDRTYDRITNALEESARDLRSFIAKIRENKRFEWKAMRN